MLWCAVAVPAVGDGQLLSWDLADLPPQARERQSWKVYNEDGESSEELEGSDGEGPIFKGAADGGRCTFPHKLGFAHVPGAHHVDNLLSQNIFAMVPSSLLQPSTAAIWPGISSTEMGATCEQRWHMSVQAAGGGKWVLLLRVLPEAVQVLTCVLPCRVLLQGILACGTGVSAVLLQHSVSSA
jgi:hypothetical protein